MKLIENKGKTVFVNSIFFLLKRRFLILRTCRVLYLVVTCGAAKANLKQKSTYETRPIWALKRLCASSWNKTVWNWRKTEKGRLWHAIPIVWSIRRKSLPTLCETRNNNNTTAMLRPCGKLAWRANIGEMGIRTYKKSKIANRISDGCGCGEVLLAFPRYLISFQIKFAE